MTTRTKLTVAIVAICFIVSAVLLHGQATYVTGATGTFITNAATRLRMTATNLLGRTSAGSGPIQEIAIGSGLVMTNQTLSATGGGGGGTTINATDGVIPVRADATTFTNSPIKVNDQAAMVVFGPNTNFIFNASDAEMFIGPNTLGYIGSFGGSGSRILSYVDSSAGDTDNNQLYLISTDGSNTATVSLEALPGNNSTAVKLIDVTSGVNRSGGIDITAGATDRIYARTGGTNTFVSDNEGAITSVNPASSTNFYAAAASGYTGLGTKFLSDDGTYKTGGGAAINSTDGVIPVRGSATMFTNSQMSVSASGAITITPSDTRPFTIANYEDTDIQNYVYNTIFSSTTHDANSSYAQIDIATAGNIATGGSTATYIQASANNPTNNISSAWTIQNDLNPGLTYLSGTYTNTEFIRIAETGSIVARNSGTSTNFYAAASSGYTGGGTNFLSDDGTYKVPAIIGQSGSVTNNGISWTVGSGSPEGAITAPIGSFYSRTDGSTNTTWYVKVSGAGNTGWVAK